jgi:hypothetical protein
MSSGDKSIPPLSARSQRFLDGVRDLDSPSEGDRARVRRQLAFKIAAGAVVGVGVGKAANAGGLWAALSSTTGKVVAVAAITATGGALTASYVVKERAAERAAQSVLAEPVVPAVQQVPTTIETAPSIAAPDLADGDNSAKPEPDRSPAGAGKVRALRANRPAVARVVKPSADEEAEPVAEVPSDSARVLAEETVALSQARHALQSGKADVALAKLDEYARRFPSAMLAEEAAATRVLSLARLDRKDDACKEAREFQRRWPRSPQIGRIRAVCPGL